MRGVELAEQIGNVLVAVVGQRVVCLTVGELSGRQADVVTERGSVGEAVVAAKPGGLRLQGAGQVWGVIGPDLAEAGVFADDLEHMAEGGDPSLVARFGGEPEANEDPPTPTRATSAHAAVTRVTRRRAEERGDGCRGSLIRSA